MPPNVWRQRRAKRVRWTPGLGTRVGNWRGAGKPAAECAAKPGGKARAEKERGPHPRGTPRAEEALGRCGKVVDGTKRGLEALNGQKRERYNRDAVKKAGKARIAKGRAPGRKEGEGYGEARQV